MPIYEYECGSCHHRLEAMQSFSEAPLTNCPNCNQSTLAKMVSPSSFHLKGGGWYVTDIRDKGKPKPESNTESSSESKPADSTGSTGTDKK